MDHQNNYHKTDIHARLIRNMALNVALLRNDRDYEISEYDVQAFMALFLRKNLLHTAFEVHRESHGKYDCAIALKGSPIPAVLYELKTFLKPSERIKNKVGKLKPKKPAAVAKLVEHDFLKLLKGLNNGVRAYFMLVGTKKDFEGISENENSSENVLEFISQHLKNARQWITIKSDGKEARLRPSQKTIILDVMVLSWELKPVPMNKNLKQSGGALSNGTMLFEG